MRILSPCMCIKLFAIYSAPFERKEGTRLNCSIERKRTIKQLVECTEKGDATDGPANIV